MARKPCVRILDNADPPKATVVKCGFDSRPRHHTKMKKYKIVEVEKDVFHLYWKTRFFWHAVCYYKTEPMSFYEREVAESHMLKMMAKDERERQLDEERKRFKPKTWYY